MLSLYIYEIDDMISPPSLVIIIPSTIIQTKSPKIPNLRKLPKSKCKLKFVCFFAAPHHRMGKVFLLPGFGQ